MKRILHPHQQTAEQWRPVIGYEGSYEVSDHGSVRSVDRIVTQMDRWGCLTERRLKGRVLRQTVDRGCYAYGRLQVKLCPGGAKVNQRTRLVHHLVLEAFIGSRPHGCEAAHADGNPANNILSNLRWATPKNNSADKLQHGTQPRGLACYNTKLSDDDVSRVRTMRRSGRTFQSIADFFGISISQAYRVNAGQRRGTVQ